MRTIFISEMKTTIIYTVTFLAFSLANSSMAMSNLFICQQFLCRQCGKISQPQGAHTRSQLILDQLYLRKTRLTGGNTNGNCEENPQHYYYIWNSVPKVILLNKLQNFKKAFFSIVDCTSATSYNCDATITFFVIAQQ